MPGVSDARLPALVGALVATAACTADPPPSGPATDLAPYVSPIEHADRPFAPARSKPLVVVAGPDGDVAWVALQGTPDHPARHVVAIGVPSGEELGRVEVGASPSGLALHPDGRTLLALSRFSDRAAVIDTAALDVVDMVPVDPYSVAAAFSADGSEVWIANRWRDDVEVRPVHAARGGARPDHHPGRRLPVGVNPRDMALSPDGDTLAVASPTAMTVTLVDTTTRKVRAVIEVGAPANDVVYAGPWLIVPTLSASTHHLPTDGPDTDGDGTPGDGTPNVNFQDLQNEIAVYDGATGAPAHRYTSDTLCCRDYRDVDPDDAERRGDLLPPRDTWIVGGALPEQATVQDDADGTWVIVSYSASNQLQRFLVDLATGALSPGLPASTSGHNPHGLAAAGGHVVVAHRLSDSVGIYAAGTLAPVAEAAVGDPALPPFPASDAELGELINFVTAPLTVDGDQSCAHCHREDGNIDKAFSMPLTRYGGRGMRMTMAYRGAADSRPWFFESSMDEHNFKPVLNEFSRIENFCCTDYTLWPGGAPAACSTSPPPECAAETNPSSSNGFDTKRGGPRAPFQHARPTAYAWRDGFIQRAAARLVGRATTFGDAVFFEDLLSGQRRPIELDFAGITRLVGAFLLAAPRLLPNPNDPDTASVRRGQALFNSPSTGCSACHPAPTFAVSTDNNPLAVPLRMGPVISPMRSPDGVNLDLFAAGFMETFPETEMERCEEVCGEAMCAEDPSSCDDLRDVSFGVPPLRGIWDRAPSLFHDGRARGLRQALATPGHPALREGEEGFNERDGVPDTHGGTSHLTQEQLEDLMGYLMTL